MDKRHPTNVARMTNRLGKHHQTKTPGVQMKPSFNHMKKRNAMKKAEKREKNKEEMEQLKRQAQHNKYLKKQQENTLQRMSMVTRGLKSGNNNGLLIPRRGGPQREELDRVTNAAERVVNRRNQFNSEIENTKRIIRDIEYELYNDMYPDNRNNQIEQLKIHKSYLKNLLEPGLKTHTQTYNNHGYKRNKNDDFTITSRKAYGGGKKMRKSMKQRKSKRVNAKKQRKSKRSTKSKTRRRSRK